MITSKDTRSLLQLFYALLSHTFSKPKSYVSHTFFTAKKKIIGSDNELQVGK